MLREVSFRAAEIRTCVGMHANQISNDNESICGVMLESNLVDGRQDITDPTKLLYGQSITDACIGWDETEELIEI